MPEEVTRELFRASDKDKKVWVLGVEVNCTPTDLKIYINGQDLTKTLAIDEIKIMMEKKASP
jgi:hypothetical protein